MHIGSIDASATLGTSWLHRTGPVAKLLAFALVLGAVVVSWNVLVVASIATALAAAVVSARLPGRLAFGLAAYPSVFALVFALSSAPDAWTGTVIVLKAVTAALAAVTVVLSTPYPQIFAPVQRITPSLVGDALLMTYRSTFLMLEKFESLLRAVRLRSGLARGNPIAAVRVSSRALGGLLLYSLDLSQRDYDIMRVRGYDERLRVALPRSESRPRDAALVATAAALLATSALWRVGAGTLNPYTWLVPLVPAALLVAALLRTRRRR